MFKSKKSAIYPVNKYYNSMKYCHFNIYEQDNFQAPHELSMKNVLSPLYLIT